MKISKYHIALLLFLTGIVIEFGFLSFWKGNFGIKISPAIWMFGGLLTCLSGWYIISQEKEVNIQRSDKWNQLMVYGTFVIGAIIFGLVLNKIFGRFPIDPLDSDIVPSIQLYVQRLLAGKTVYTPLQFETHVVLPTYFPMMWAPYLFSELLQIDYRWTAYLVFLLGLFLWSRKLAKSNIPAWEAVMKMAIPFLLLFIYADHERGSFAYAVELMPIGFYLFLVYGVNHRSNFVIAAGIICCLLSRYAFTFWLPVYLFILWREFDWKAIQVSILAGLGVLFIYIIPFLGPNPQILLDGLAYYDTTILAEWSRVHTPDPALSPFQLTRGLSYAVYFLPEFGQDATENIALNKKVHLAVSLFIAALILAMYYVLKPKGEKLKWYLIVALKFYFIFFYGFFYMPFNYLFLLPFILSIPLLFQIKWHIGPAK